MKELPKPEDTLIANAAAAFGLSIKDASDQYMTALKDDTDTKMIVASMEEYALLKCEALREENERLKNALEKIEISTETRLSRYAESIKDLAKQALKGE